MKFKDEHLIEWISIETWLQGPAVDYNISAGIVHKQPVYW
jgi:hypothetical protein